MQQGQTCFVGGDRNAGSNADARVDFDLRLQLTVIQTTPEATLCALRLGSKLAKGVRARIRLVVTEVVPFRLPLENPPISADFLHRRQERLVAYADIDDESVAIEILLCRNAKRALRQFLSPGSLVLVGGRPTFWNSGYRLSKWLERIGHHVNFADVKHCGMKKQTPSRRILDPKTQMTPALHH